MTAWETVIGLECHVELSTRTKMFCGCRNEFGAEPNTNVCPVCLGHPGSLPVPNREAIASIVKIGLALDCTVAPDSLFHRKNYFYPDMPKNFQISQYDLPICVGGHLDVDVDGETRRIGITRVHMEEDTGKTTHGSASGRIHEAEFALVDFNRAGVPLVECVSEPDMRSPDEAGAYLRELRATLESLDVSDVRMEEGSLRCDANISLRPEGAEALGTKVEIKNMNSIRSLERALAFEIERQTKALENEETIVQETRHWDEDAGGTKSLRSKEEAFDYRYFPEPDIPPLQPDREWVEEIRATLPELPRTRRERYERELGLRPDVARVLVADRGLASFFDDCVDEGAEPVLAANWITQDLAGFLNERKISIIDALEQERISTGDLVGLVRLVDAGDISTTQAKKLLDERLRTVRAAVNIVVSGSISAKGEVIPKSGIAEMVSAQGVKQLSDPGALGAIADEVLAENQDAVEQFRAGKDGVIGFLVGQVMKKSGGSADPKLAQELLRGRLTG